MRPSPVTPSATAKNMKALIALTFIVIFGWLAVVTFCGPELARAINGPEPVKAKATRHLSR
jgi:hypothetical protein